MTNYKEILRLHSLGINNTRIAASCGCARGTVIPALQRAREQDLSWIAAQKKLPGNCIPPVYFQSMAWLKMKLICTPVRCVPFCVSTPPLVKVLQELLNEQGANLDVDGNFGSKTEAAADKYGVG